MKIKSTKNLIAVGALAIMLLGTQKAFAYVPGVWDPQAPVQTNQQAFTEIPSYDTTPAPQPTTSFVVAPAPQVTYVYSQAPKQTQPTSQVVYKTVTTNSTVTTPATNDLPPVVSSDQNTTSGFAPSTNTNNLSALSLNGSGGFMPSSVWQWLAVIFLILVIIIIARMFNKPEPHHVAVH